MFIFWYFVRPQRETVSQRRSAFFFSSNKYFNAIEVMARPRTLKLSHQKPSWWFLFFTSFLFLSLVPFVTVCIAQFSCKCINNAKKSLLLSYIMRFKIKLLLCLLIVRRRQLPEIQLNFLYQRLSIADPKRSLQKVLKLNSTKFDETTGKSLVRLYLQILCISFDDRVLRYCREWIVLFHFLQSTY